jgi:hypothetical protein
MPDPAAREMVMEYGPLVHQRPEAQVAEQQLQPDRRWIECPTDEVPGVRLLPERPAGTDVVVGAGPPLVLLCDRTLMPGLKIARSRCVAET